MNKYRLDSSGLYSAGRVVPVARDSACKIAWRTGEKPLATVRGIVLVAAIMPEFPAGTCRRYIGTTTGVELVTNPYNSRGSMRNIAGCLYSAGVSGWHMPALWKDHCCTELVRNSSPRADAANH